jgi:Dyp-type peroxidase family
MIPPLQLADIQGNVLQGYGFGYSAFANVRIEAPGSGRALLADLLPRVTNARRWNGEKPLVALNLAVSREGLERLDAPPLDSFPDEFRQGMAARAGRLEDTGASDPENWQPELKPGQIQLLVIVHARREKARRELLESLQDRVDSVRGLELDEPELGSVGGDDVPYTREHFGFADGFGQPAVAGQTGPEFLGQGIALSRRRFLRGSVPAGWRLIAPGEFILGYRDEDDVIPPAPRRPFAENGTFMVYRKLQQDVAAFRMLLDELADEHFSGNRELAAAKLAGRWRDGAPLMTSPGRPDAALGSDKWRTNDFRFAHDANGYTCPIGAHVRRANPRDSLPGGSERSRRHRIIRRGMPYGDPLPEGADGGDRGLLFVCFNASIARQFEVVNGWLAHGQAFGLEGGDLLTHGGEDPRMTIDGDPPVRFRSRLVHRPLVTTRGGEYLFLPSVRGLAALARGDTGA